MTFTLEEIEAVLDEKRKWYDESIFPEFTADEKDVSRDRVSASMARHTIDHLKRMFREEAEK